MDNQSDSKVPVILDHESQPIVVAGWSQKELELLKRAETEGSKPISTSLSLQMLSLFLEGYSCNEIAKQNKGLAEIDVIVCRKKYNWDEQRDTYVYDLTCQVREKLTKSKLESIEWATNALAVFHKSEKDQQLKYLQTGKEEDKPEMMIKSPGAYKQMQEILQKITGEDRITKVTTDSTLKVEGTIQTVAALHPELQAKLLKKLSEPLPSKQLSGKKNE